MVDSISTTLPGPASTQQGAAAYNDAAGDRALARKVYMEAFQALSTGASSAEATGHLTAMGLDNATAATVVANVERFKRELAAAYRSAGLKSAGVGLLWCIGGIAVTALTYAMASGGGTFIVAWGAVIFGAVQALRGLVHSARHATQDQLIQAFSL